MEALKRAFEPSLKNCSVTVGNDVTQLNELFRDQAVQVYRIMSEADFESLAVSFNCEEDPVTKQPIKWSFTRSSFEESSLPLFKLAAFDKLKSLKGQENVDCSVKY